MTSVKLLSQTRTSAAPTLLRTGLLPFRLKPQVASRHVLFGSDTSVLSIITVLDCPVADAEALRIKEACHCLPYKTQRQDNGHKGRCSHHATQGTFHRLCDKHRPWLSLLQTAAFGRLMSEQPALQSLVTKLLLITENQVAVGNPRSFSSFQWAASGQRCTLHLNSSGHSHCSHHPTSASTSGQASTAPRLLSSSLPASIGS